MKRIVVRLFVTVTEQFQPYDELEQTEQQPYTRDTRSYSRIVRIPHVAIPPVGSCILPSDNLPIPRLIVAAAPMYLLDGASRLTEIVLPIRDIVGITHEDEAEEGAPGDYSELCRKLEVTGWILERNGLRAI